MRCLATTICLSLSGKLLEAAAESRFGYEPRSSVTVHHGGLESGQPAEAINQLFATLDALEAHATKQDGGDAASEYATATPYNGAYGQPTPRRITIPELMGILQQATRDSREDSHGQRDGLSRRLKGDGVPAPSAYEVVALLSRKESSSPMETNQMSDNSSVPIMEPGDRLIDVSKYCPSCFATMTRESTMANAGQHEQRRRQPMRQGSPSRESLLSCITGRSTERDNRRPVEIDNIMAEKYTYESENILMRRHRGQSPNAVRPRSAPITIDIGSVIIVPRNELLSKRVEQPAGERETREQYVPIPQPQQMAPQQATPKQPLVRVEAYMPQPENQEAATYGVEQVGETAMRQQLPVRTVIKVQPIYEARPTAETVHPATDQAQLQAPVQVPTPQYPAMGTNTVIRVAPDYGQQHASGEVPASQADMYVGTQTSPLGTYVQYRAPQTATTQGGSAEITVLAPVVEQPAPTAIPATVQPAEPEPNKQEIHVVVAETEAAMEAAKKADEQAEKSEQANEIAPAEKPEEHKPVAKKNKIAKAKGKGKAKAKGKGRRAARSRTATKTGK